MSDCARRAEDGSFCKSTKIGKNAKSQNGGKMKVLLKDNQVPIHNTRGKFSPHWMDSCIVSEQQSFSWIQMTSKSQTIQHGQSYTFTLERLVRPKTRKGDPGKS
ncbi:hypothetical protein HYC85_029123 [Camellia sinensis]|uniref:Uncharacterized protein n=1 Tax=Camellia sinensis TaxID=4442 RepID=A0A7J7FX73_CAMSI|nr:hypothetical protein HYC85_029123 [Camellia sinensis]